MFTNLFLDLDGPFFLHLSPFVNIRVHSWLKFLFLKSISCVTSQALRLPLRRSLFLLAPQVKEERQQSHQRKAGEGPRPSSEPGWPPRRRSGNASRLPRQAWHTCSDTPPSSPPPTEASRADRSSRSN